MSIYDQFPIFTDMGEVDLITTKRRHAELSSEETELSLPDGQDLNSYESDLLINGIDSLTCRPTKQPKTDSRFSLFTNTSFSKQQLHQQRHDRAYLQLKSSSKTKKALMLPDFSKLVLMPPDAQNIRLVVPYAIFPYQLEIVNWLLARERNPTVVPYFTPGISGGIIAMLMGLGKTLVMAYLMMMTLEQQRSLQLPTLYVCPANLIGTVFREFHKFLGGQVTVAIYHKNYMQTGSIINVENIDVMIVSYTTVSSQIRRQNSLFTQQLWYRIILDESQDIRNEKTQSFKAVMQLKSSRRICMTGTPIHNHLRDVYHQLLFCGFQVPPEVKQSKTVTVPFFKEYLLPHLVLRDYSCIDPSLLPAKHTHVEIIPMHPMEAALHSQIMDIHKKNYDGAKTSYGKIHHDFVEKMRRTVDAELAFCVAAHLLYNPEKQTESTHICNNLDRQILGLPPIVFGFEFTSWLADINGEAGVKSSKLQRLHSILQSIYDKGEKVIIFANKIKPLQLAIKSLPPSTSQYDQPYRFICKDVRPEQRELYYSQFRTDPKVFMLFSTLTIGNRGLNLTEANHVIFLQPWYCWAPMEQAIYRAYRIGQTKPVHCYVLLSKGTSDERIYNKVMENASTSKEALDIMSIF